MTKQVEIRVSDDLSDDLKAFTDAWKRIEAGEQVAERVLAFESWEGLAAVMTGERYRLLRHLHAHPERSVNALARALRRPYRRVPEDIAILERAGLVDRSGGEVRATADKLSAVVTP